MPTADRKPAHDLDSSAAPALDRVRPRRRALGALLLFIAGLAPIVFVTVTRDRGGLALACGVLAETLALILGLAAWRERLGKAATLAAAVALSIAAYRAQSLFPAVGASPLLTNAPAVANPVVPVQAAIPAVEPEVSVAELLQQAEAAAQQKNWTRAAEAYLRAFDHPDFHWRTFEFQTPSRCLSLQMGLALQLSGDHRNHERLCTFLAELDDRSPAPNDADRYAKTMLTNWKNLSPELHQRAIALARFGVDQERLRTGRNSRWICQTGGMAEYHAGQYERAAELLKQAEGDRDVACRGGAQLYRALALKALGRSEEAAALLQQAEQLLAEPLQTRTGSGWWNLDLCKLALDEARVVIRGGR